MLAGELIGTPRCGQLAVQIAGIASGI